MGIAILCMVNHTSIDSDQFIRPNLSAKTIKCHLEQKNSTLIVQLIKKINNIKKNCIF